MRSRCCFGSQPWHLFSSQSPETRAKHFQAFAQALINPACFWAPAVHLASNCLFLISHLKVDRNVRLRPWHSPTKLFIVNLFYHAMGPTFLTLFWKDVNGFFVKRAFDGKLELAINQCKSEEHTS